MRKIIVFNLISLDGYFAGADGNLDWHNVDDEFNRFAVKHTGQFGAIIFGRVTYKMFEEFWPKVVDDPKFSKEDRKIARIIDSIEKLVFSKTLKKVTWKNSLLLKEIVPKEISYLKKKPGKDIAVFGSGTIAQGLTNLNLIDEYRFLVNPIVLGKGKPMFKHMKHMLKLKLLTTRKFNNGNVLLTYKPINKPILQKR